MRVIGEQGRCAVAKPFGDLYERVPAFVDQQAREAVPQVVGNGAAVVARRLVLAIDDGRGVGDRGQADRLTRGLSCA